jgi:hypothetical protein
MENTNFTPTQTIALQEATQQNASNAPNALQNQGLNNLSGQSLSFPGFTAGANFGVPGVNMIQQSNGVPLIIGVTPLQQQLSALAGLAPQQMMLNNNGNTNAFDPQMFQLQQQQPQQQQVQQQQQQQQPQVQQQQQPGQVLQQPNMAMPFNLQQLQLAQQLFASGQQLNLGSGGMFNLEGMLGAFGVPGAPGGFNLQQGFAAPVQGLSAGPAMLMNPQQQQPQQQLFTANGISEPSAPVSVPNQQSDATSKPPGEVEWAEPFAGKGKKDPPFPLKLHQILSNPEFQEYICFNPHGRSWRILKPQLFEQVVIPLYFRHAKYASFMRQVNGWGFKRIVSISTVFILKILSVFVTNTAVSIQVTGNDHNSYYHGEFIHVYSLYL